jgi:hypothetical protein
MKRFLPIIFLTMIVGCQATHNNGKDLSTTPINVQNVPE